MCKLKKVSKHSCLAHKRQKSLIKIYHKFLDMIVNKFKNKSVENEDNVHLRNLLKG